jgi:hypothetical protein
LRRRAKELAKTNPAESKKWSGQEFLTKLSTYNQDNSIELFKDCEKGVFPTTKFFQDNQTEVFDLFSNGDKYEMFESMRIYIERFGRPYNYLASVS